MCAVSMVGDFYTDKWQKPYTPFSPPPVQWPTLIPSEGIKTMPVTTSPVTREEFEQLRKDVADMKELLIRAKKYDEDNGEKDCEMDEKVALLKQMAKLVGVDLSEVFGK